MKGILQLWHIVELIQDAHPTGHVWHKPDPSKYVPIIHTAHDEEELVKLQTAQFTSPEVLQAAQLMQSQRFVTLLSS
jgi:hypothetical protein